MLILSIVMIIIIIILIRILMLFIILRLIRVSERISAAEARDLGCLPRLAIDGL